MAQGFKDIQVPTVREDYGYKTIFEKVKEEAGGENKSYLWYRNAVMTNFRLYMLLKQLEKNSGD